MENKADVKAIMARFQAGGASTDETSSTPAGRSKQPLHPTLSSGPSVQKKPVLESLSGSAINAPPKPAFLKNTVSTKSDTDAHEPNKTKALASRFSSTQDDTNNKPFTIHKQQTPLKPPLSQAPETKGFGPKPPLNKPSLSSTLSESKPPFPKPSPAITSKPSWVKEDSGGGAALNTSITPSKITHLERKPSSSIAKLRQHGEETEGRNTDTANKPSPLANSTSKPSSNFRNAQNMFNKENTEQTDSVVANKPPLTATKSIPPPKPSATKKPSIKKPHKTFPPTSSTNGDSTSEPKRNPLPNSLALGPAPAKPNRPPKVNLQNFKRGAEASSDGPGFKKPVFPAPPTSQPSNHNNHAPQPPQPAVPSLPPRHPGTMNQQEDFYDDVDDRSSAPPPPPPPSSGHPSLRPKEENNDDDEDGEMYEDLDERWEAADQKQDKKKEKEEKEEKKRLEAEKKEQKEREKKEQDARKKFKLVGPLEAIHQGKARADCRGGKTDLALKQGDPLDIIRVQGNPEGKWLGRSQDGSIGYVKTTSVEIDFNTLKNCQVQQSYDPEVYDDIDVISDNSGIKGPGVVLPPLPGEGGEIYDDVVDPNLEVRVPPPSQFTADGNSDKSGTAIDEEIYDDVDSQNVPPPPPISSLPAIRGKSRSEDMDPKKQKKFEKEEKEFRKKFKYEGEIQVLYQVTISNTLTNKKWSAKELPVKAGETLDVIVKAVDNKLICRNDDGKFGYVSTSHIATDDGDIYDDIGDDCIYDND
ncbi:FYN-binding protein 1 isoform X2 [Acanthochromis polyacanthus]|uniref:FYN binding protein 1 n=1 Tax=Acanthochromis polyacanthus TaxID=80966 RepID=A0A3Q1FXA7_9TELE|nr:FYN-binding protein 1 isoform X2 [Acanthochromis polyacanthus]